MVRRYSELIKLKTLEERFEYCALNGIVGKDTFGMARYLNQELYHSSDYRSWRNRIILRDESCELGLPDFNIFGRVYVHHLNPITIDDIIERRKCVMDPENAICVSFDMHQALHYGDFSLVKPMEFNERTPNDTIPWR